MEDWYLKQEFFTQGRMEKIKAWMCQNFTGFTSVGIEKLEYAA